MEVPDWLPQDLSNPKYDERGPRKRIRGSNKNGDIACEDFVDVLEVADPPGYLLNQAILSADHGRGKRLNWTVEWVSESYAERQFERKQLSRFEIQT